MSHVLILDDDEIVAKLLSTMLTRTGHQVRSARCVEDAWTALDQLPPDILILDTDLGEENGVEFLARVRADAVFGELAVLVSSSVARRDVVQRYLELGVQGIEVKPSTPERLRAAIEQIMRAPWRDKLFESPKTIKARTGFVAASLAPLYLAAAVEIFAALEDMEMLREDLLHPAGLGRLDELRLRALAIGCLPLRRLVERTLKAVSDGETPRVAELLRRFPATARLLAMQAGVDPSTVEPKAKADPVTVSAPAPAAGPASASEAPAGSVASAPAVDAPGEKTMDAVAGDSAA